MMSNLYSDELYNIAISYFETKEYDKALEVVDGLLNVDKFRPDANNLKANILIDSWDFDPNTKFKIRQAISYLERAIDGDPNSPVFHYNLGNAWLGLVSSEFRKNEFQYSQEIIDNLESARKSYKLSLKLNESQPEAWINLGNVLDYLGRYIEALECYDRAILQNPHFYNAWGNRGITNLRLFHKSQETCTKNQLYHDAMIYIRIELELFPDFDIDKKTKQLVGRFFKENAIEVNSEQFIMKSLPKKRFLHDQTFNLYKQIDENLALYYTNFCEQHSLFLNLFFDSEKNPCKGKDLIVLKFHTDIDENDRAYKIKNRWNSLIDEYKTSRLLLVLSQFKHHDFEFLDDRKYPQDYRLTYLTNVEFLKNSFLVAIGIFDKIAFFLNEYSNLNLNEDIITFSGKNSIFHHSKEFILKNNWQVDLIALQSIKTELESGEFKELIKVRNYLVHRNLILQDHPGKLKSINKKENGSKERYAQNYMDINEFFNMTISTIRLIRNTLFSLSFFIQEKEGRINGFPIFID